MKKILTAVMMLIFTITAVSAKDVKAEALTSLKSDLNAYKEATLNKDVDKLMDYVYPTVFKITPREQMTKMFKQMIESGKMPEIKKLDIKDIEELQKFDKGYFTTVNYTMDMNMNLGKMPKEMQPKMVEMMKAQLGKSAKVNLDEKTGILNIVRDAKFIAIKEGKDNWKFIELEQVGSLAQAKLLPASIVEKLKK